MINNKVQYNAKPTSTFNFLKEVLKVVYDFALYRSP